MTSQTMENIINELTDDAIAELSMTSQTIENIINELTDDAIAELSVTSQTMENTINELTDDARFYKSRVVNILGYLIDSSYGFSLLN